jgi:type IV pilus assembly protein PilM
VEVKKDIINDYTAVITEAGLGVQVVDVDSFAAQNLFEVAYPEMAEKTAVMIDIGAGIMNINVVKNGVSAFTRDITIGGSNFTEEIQKEIGVSYEDAELLKLGGSSDRAEPEEIKDILSRVTDTVVLEIQRSLDFFSATAAEEELNVIFLAGGSSLIPGLPMAIEERLGTPVEVLHSFKGFSVSPKSFDPDYLEAMGPVAAVAAGLALRRTDER